MFIKAGAPYILTNNIEEIKKFTYITSDKIFKNRIGISSINIEEIKFAYISPNIIKE